MEWQQYGLEPKIRISHPSIDGKADLTRWSIVIVAERVLFESKSYDDEELAVKDAHRVREKLKLMTNGLQFSGPY